LFRISKEGDDDEEEHEEAKKVMMIMMMKKNNNNKKNKKKVKDNNYIVFETEMATRIADGIGRSTNEFASFNPVYPGTPGI
jgi:hypothetical protein